MGLNKEKISRIIGESKRFCSPFSDPEPYYIIDSDTDRPDRNSIDLFYRKLTYAVRNADILIGGAFDDGFYNFYGINRDIVRSPSEIADQLYFDSFVLNIKDNSIGACGYLPPHPSSPTFHPPGSPRKVTFFAPKVCRETKCFENAVTRHRNLCRSPDL